MTDVKVMVPPAVILDVVNGQLEQLAAHRVVIDETVERLTAIRTLAEEIAGLGGRVEDDDGPPEVPADPPLPVGPRRGRSSSSTRSPAKPTKVKAPATSPVQTSSVQAVLMASLAAYGPLSMDGLVDDTGLSKNQLKRVIQSLVKDGGIVATGATRCRVYDLPKDTAAESSLEPQGGGVGSTVAAALADAVNGPIGGSMDEIKRPELAEKILKAVDLHDYPVTARQIADELVRNRGEVAQLMRGMARDGGPLVEVRLVGSAVTYRRSTEA